MSIIIIVTYNITSLKLDCLVKAIINFYKEADNIHFQSREDIIKLCLSY